MTASDVRASLQRQLQERGAETPHFLALIDDYMFDIATMDLETCKSIIELSLNIRIQEIQWKRRCRRQLKRG